MMRTEDAPAAAVSATAMAAVRATRCMRNLRSRYFTPAGLPYIKARMRRTSVFFAVLLALVCARSSLQGQGASAPLTGPKGLDFDTFRTKVQPIFLATRGEHARCYACHSQGTPLRLQELSPGAKEWTEEQSRANFQAMQRVVVPGQPKLSRLLLMPLAPGIGRNIGGMRMDSGRPSSLVACC